VERYLFLNQSEMDLNEKYWKEGGGTTGGAGEGGEGKEGKEGGEPPAGGGEGFKL